MEQTNSNINRRVSFQELKSKVGIDDVAYALGYRLDRRAGIGHYFEMVLKDGFKKVDTIVISNSKTKSAQRFFRRDGSYGDVVTLVKENLNSFNDVGKDDWEKVTNVLSRFANMPAVEHREDLKAINSNRGNQPFDPDRYDVKPIDASKIPSLFKIRGFDDNTVLAFSPFIRLISDRNNKNFTGFNIGFPYTSMCQEGVVGYEIRGYGGFKSKAAGTNSNSAAWIADFSNNDRYKVSNVYFFESAFDAMAFYQLNRLKLNNEVALVSLGGTFSDKQILGVIDAYPNARFNDCFDNDIAGRINAMRLQAVVENMPIKIQKDGDDIIVSAREKMFALDITRPLVTQLREHLPIKKRIGQWLPPKDFKDWNDCLLGKAMSVTIHPDKHDRNENLAQQRNSSIKI